MNRPTTPRRIIIVGADFGFPNGSGATARVRCYAEGLRLSGAVPYVVIAGVVSPDELDDGNTEVAGEWNGVRYEYASGAVCGASTFLGRRRQELRSIRRLAHLILPRGDGGLDAVLLYGWIPRWLVPLRLLCTLGRTAFLLDVSEYPYVYRPGVGPVRRMGRALFLRAGLKLPDGVIVITGFLEQSLAPLLRRRAWLLRVPIMVDASRFDVPVEPTPGLVAYAGHLGHSAELNDLVAAVELVARRDPAVRLAIIGGVSDGQRRDLIDRIAAHGLAGSVELVGPASADAIPALLARATVLVLARADGLFSRAGMPTKLGEYLASGRPVVVTATGDIPRYLHDGVDSYLVPPGDVARLSEAIERALHDPLAASVGLAGRGVAKRSFDPALHMARVLEALRGSAGLGQEHSGHNR